MSDIVTVPDFVDYPNLYDVNSNLELFNNVYCYFIDGYDLNGYSLYLGFRNDCFLVRVADFYSNEISADNLDENVYKILSYSDMFKNVMKSARIPDALFYISNNDGVLMLVDMMLSANKFVGPGMLRDLFGNIIETQKVNFIDVFDKNKISEYHGNIIKPSRFRYSTEDDVIRPLYGKV